MKQTIKLRQNANAGTMLAKTFLFAIIFLCFTTVAQSQTSFGIKAGANFSKLNGSDVDDAKKKAGMYGGLLVNIPVTPSFSIQPELLYSNLGAMWKENGDKDSYNLNYIALPLMFQYNHKSGFYAETGPELSYLVSAKYKYDYEDENGSEDIKDDLKKTNLAWGIGAGYEFKNGLGVGARHNFGISNIAKEGSKIRNNAFSIGLFYKF